VDSQPKQSERGQALNESLLGMQRNEYQMPQGIHQESVKSSQRTSKQSFKTKNEKLRQRYWNKEEQEQRSRSRSKPDTVPTRGPGRGEIRIKPSTSRKQSE